MNSIKCYEILLILRKELNFKKRIDLIKFIIKQILKDNGVIFGIQYLGLQPVYYNERVINNAEKGKFTLLSVYLEPSKLKTLMEYLKQNNSILRQSVIKKNLI